jgi:hypothetical protein
LTATVTAIPKASATGTQTSRQRRDRQPVAATKSAAVISCAATGIHPWVSDIVASWLS